MRNNTAIGGTRYHGHRLASVQKNLMSSLIFRSLHGLHLSLFCACCFDETDHWIAGILLHYSLRHTNISLSRCYKLCQPIQQWQCITLFRARPVAAANRNITSRLGHSLLRVFRMVRSIGCSVSVGETDLNRRYGGSEWQNGPMFRSCPALRNTGHAALTV